MGGSLIGRLAIAQPRLGKFWAKEMEANKLDGGGPSEGEDGDSLLPLCLSDLPNELRTATTPPPSPLVSLGSVSSIRHLGRCRLVKALHARAPFRPTSFFPFLTFILGTVSSPGRTYRRDRAPNRIFKKVLVHPVDYSSTRTEGATEQQPTQTKPSGFAGLFSTLSSSNISTSQLLTSKYL